MRQLVCRFVFASLIATSAMAADQMSATTLTQLEALLADKAARTPAQKKMSSQLIYAARDLAGQVLPGVPNMRSSVRADAAGMVLVDVDATITDALIAQIIGWGGRVIVNIPELRSLRLNMPVANMEALAGHPDVKHVRPADIADVRPVKNPRKARAAEEGSTTNAGSVNTEGDATHQAALVRSTFNINGSGVKIGVMSDGVDSLAQSQASGNLPASVMIIPGQAGTGDEGTAMLEIVHDIAPGAQLVYAKGGGAGSTQATMAQNIRALRDAGCSIIVDDITFFAESPFQDGVISQAVNDVSGTGVLFFSSAANSGNLLKGTSGTWEGNFVNSGFTINQGAVSGQIHSFGVGGTLNTCTSTAQANGGVAKAALYWSDPMGASSNDYDLIITNALNQIIRSSTDTQSGTQDPFEFIGTLNAGEKVGIVKFSGADRFLHIDTFRAQITIQTSGNIRGHNACAAENAFCIAAVDVATAFPNAFIGGATNPVETFSSDGPRRIFFKPDGSPITPGNFLATGGTLLQKPDLTAADGNMTTVNGFNPFFGTSSAAPHCAAIAALIKSFNPAFTPAQIRALMQTTALDIEGPGFDTTTGFGIVMPMRALMSVGSLSITAGANATAVFSPAAQNVTLTAAVTSTGGIVSEGTVTFQVKNLGANVGTAMTSTPVANGAASVSYALPAGLAGGVYQISANYNGSPKFSPSADITKTLTITSPPVFTSLPTATPNPVTVGQSVSLSAAATSTLPLTYAWNFGDGTSASGASVSHVFSPAGTYSVSITATDSAGLATTATLSLTANAATTGPGVLAGEIDSDGDGFSDTIESAAGTSSQSITSTPGGQAAAQKAGFAQKKLSVTKKQKMTLSGTLNIPANFIVSAKIVVADINGFTQKFTLDAKGNGTALKGKLKDSFKVSIRAKKGKVEAQPAKFTVVLNEVPATVKDGAPLQIVVGGTVFGK